MEISLVELRENLGNLLTEVHFSKKDLIVYRRGKPLVKISSIRKLPREGVEKK